MKVYRTIKFTYNVTIIEIDVLTQSETVNRNDVESIRTTVDGSRYRFKTGDNSDYSYRFPYADNDVYSFFNTAYTQQDSFDLTFQRENDDGTFESFLAILQQPQWQDDTVGTTGKVYRNLDIRIFEA